MSDPREPVPTWPRLLTTLLGGRDLGEADTAWAMRTMMAGAATPVEVAGFLVALRAKGETVAEMSGLVAAMLEAAVRIEVPGPIVDIVGTGGDRANTVNISTMAAIVMAGAGARVVKHGNRASSSACGSADLLEELGVGLDLSPAAVATCAEQYGITFCFAQTFHPAMRHAATPRRELGVATAFNFLGPLTNPAQPRHAAVGVSDPRMAGILAGVLAGRGGSALVFRGDDGLDELTTATTSQVWVVGGGAVRQESFDPAVLGLPRSEPGALTGGDREHNAAAARAMLAGDPGPVRDAVLLNAAAGLATLDESGAELTERLATGLRRAADALDSRAAAAVLDRWVTGSRALSDRR